MSVDAAALNQQVLELRDRLDAVYRELSKVIVGQSLMIDRLLVGLLTGGHVLLEGVPGLAKTLAVRTLARCLRLEFRRIQFTPDLLPADVIGTQIYSPRTGEFTIKKGPIFANLVLADEINRAPAKVQSALLEAMQEQQVTIGDTSYTLAQPFLVLATQNPIEQEGTYPLPEAQVDRFMLKLRLDYPDKDEELEILNRMVSVEPNLAVDPVLGPDDIFELRRAIDQIYMDEKIKRYIVDVVYATRRPAEQGLDLASYLQYGASPRGTVYLARAAKARAFLSRRAYVTPDDVKAIGYDVLRHRIIVTYEAEAEDVTPDQLLRRIFDHLQVP
jgi:MoxR-like ATPase